MPHDYRPAHHQHDHARPHRRKPQRRTSNRETVQSDELSSTNGIRMVKDAQSFNHDRNPHLSQTSLPTIGAVGTPHPSLLRLERCNSKLDQDRKCLALASKRHPSKARGFARMAQATRSTRARPILCAERIPMVHSPLFTRMTNKRTLLLRARTVLLRRFLPNTPSLTRVSHRDSTPFRQQATR